LVELWMPLEGIYGDVFRGICTQSFVLNEQQEEIVLQLFAWKKKQMSVTSQIHVS